jgi:PqqD family protein of HPr-rel-A system
LRWRTVPVEGLACHRFDGELLVRNAATGDTHLLESLAAEVFSLLMHTPDGLTPADLASRLGDAAEQKDWTAAMDDLLRDFKRLGLAEPLA